MKWRPCKFEHDMGSPYATVDTVVLDRIEDIWEGKRTRMYDPRTSRKIGDLFGATRYCDLTVLICEVTNVFEVCLLDDLSDEESVAALNRTKKELFQRWEVVHPNKPMVDNPLVFRIDFRWTGKTETRQYQSIVEEEDAHCCAALDAAAKAIASETD
jgi:hypothetical protein